MTAIPPTASFDIGRVGGRLVGVIGRNFVLFLLLALLLVGVPGAMLAFAQVGFMGDVLGAQGAADPSAAFANMFAPARVGLGLAGFLIGIVGNAALQGAVIHASVSDLSGKRAEFGECLQTGLRYFLPLFCIGLIVGAAASSATLSSSSPAFCWPWPGASQRLSKWSSAPASSPRWPAAPS
jgi:hypothetical protein